MFFIKICTAILMLLGFCFLRIFIEPVWGPCDMEVWSCITYSNCSSVKVHIREWAQYKIVGVYELIINPKEKQFDDS
jgi:hypothetical protein